MSKHRGDTQESAEQRQRILSQIYEKYLQNNQNPTDKQLMTDLRKAGFVISRPTLTRDKAEIFSGDTFVTDIASKTYSYIMYRCFENLQFVDRKAREILGKKWTNSKIVKRRTEDGEVTEKTVTEETIGPHIQALRMISDTAVSISRMINGGSLQVGAALWAEHTKKQEREIETLRAKVSELESRSRC